jgi:cellobiose phosphorylase
MAADVYFREPHTGRGGWSWYTGTSSWMFKAGIEYILGLKLKGGEGFTIEPNIPVSWEGYEMKYSHEGCMYHIKVKRGSERQILLDGEVLKENIIPYLEHGSHLVEVII